MPATRERVTADDLEWAAEWLRAYNDGLDTDGSGEPEEMVPVARRVAALLDAQAAARREDAAVRRIVAANPGATTARARAALRRHMAAETRG